MSFTAKAATSGNSRALRLDSALFKSHPEFAKGEFAVHVLGPGTMLVTATKPNVAADEEDPVLTAYLAFLDGQLKTHPDMIRPFTLADVAGLDRLLDGVAVDRDEDLGDFRLP